MIGIICLRIMLCEHTEMGRMLTEAVGDGCGTSELRMLSTQARPHAMLPPTSRRRISISENADPSLDSFIKLSILKTSILPFFIHILPLLLNHITNRIEMDFSTFVDRLRSSEPAKFPSDANSIAFAKKLDSQDKLRHLRDEFIIPTKASLKKRALNGKIPGKSIDCEKGVSSP